MKGGAGPKTKDAMPKLKKLSVKEDVEEMFAGSDLSEEFKDNAATLFEAAVNARAMFEIARLEEEYEEAFVESVTEITEELTSKLDSYLEYVTEQWMEANEVAIESTLRNELMEEFIGGLKGLFAEHYIDVPQEKVNVIEALAEKVESLEAALDESINENVELKRTVAEVEKDEILESLCDGLALSQVEKFKALAEGIDFDGDLETYGKKLAFVKESYFANRKTVVSTNIEEETFEGETSTNTVYIDPAVNRYVQAITKNVKK
jgi:predicted RNase H-like nuclease (RuvC/YqgF family)